MKKCTEEKMIARATQHIFIKIHVFLGYNNVINHIFIRILSPRWAGNMTVQKHDCCANMNTQVRVSST